MVELLRARRVSTCPQQNPVTKTSDPQGPEEGDISMRFTKVLGLAAVAAVAAMAFIGTATAAAAHEVVLCDELVALCPDNHLWPAGSLALALAKNPKLVSEILGTPFVVECEDSLTVIELKASMGNPLPGSITSLEFGKLPTPTLGENCTGCTKGIHSATPLTGNLEMSGEEYFLAGSGKATLLGCPFSTTCIYGGSVKSKIEHNGSHPLHEGNNLAQILIKETLTKQSGSSGICPSTGLWEANYVLYLVHYEDPVTHEKKLGLGWPSLDE